MNRRQLLTRLGLVSGAAAMAMAPKDVFATPALTAVPGTGPMMYGGPNKAQRDAYFSEARLNGTGQRIGYVFQVPKTGTLDRFGLMMGASVVAVNGIKFSFQDISSNVPDNTADQFGVVVQASITANTWLEPSDYLGSTGLGSGSKRSVTQGD